MEDRAGMLDYLDAGQFRQGHMPSLIIGYSNAFQPFWFNALLA